MCYIIPANRGKEIHMEIWKMATEDTKAEVAKLDGEIKVAAEDSSLDAVERRYLLQDLRGRRSD